jgi:hypothetical protein
MKKTTATIILITLFHVGFSQSYKEELKKVNDFLKTFDKGYYGYLEIKDGYLYDRFASGKYSKSEIKYLGKAYEEDPGKKVSINCIDGRECVFSTYTDSYHGSIGFSQTLSFNTSELITLLDNLIAAYKKSTGNSKNDVALNDNNTTKTESVNSTKTATTSNSNYQSSLKKINEYLKTFDNGYYGYLEIKDGYLYDRFPSGKYSKSEIKYLGNAVELDDQFKVSIDCIEGKDCVFSTYTDSYHSSISFSQSGYFDKEVLVTLLNNLLSDYKKSNGKYKNEETEITNKTEITENTKTTNNSSVSAGDYQSALKKLNDYLKTFDNGYYGYFEVKDGYIYDRFKAGKYNKFKMEDIEGAEIQEQYSRVIFKCKGNNKCISTDWKVNGTEDYTQFTTGSSYNYQELADLLNDFKDSYLQNKTTTNNNSSGTAQNASDIRAQKEKERKQPNSNTTDDNFKKDLNSILDTPREPITKTGNSNSGNHTKPLNDLNEYLKTFNAATYDNVVVKGDSVFFYFKVYSMKYGSSISIKNLKQNTTIINAKSVGEFGKNEIKIFCKDDKKHFYSTYSKDHADHFRFFSNTVKDLTKMEQLVKAFVNSLSIP